MRHLWISSHQESFSVGRNNSFPFFFEIHVFRAPQWVVSLLLPRKKFFTKYLFLFSFHYLKKKYESFIYKRYKGNSNMNRKPGQQMWASKGDTAIAPCAIFLTDHLFRAAAVLKQHLYLGQVLLIRDRLGLCRQQNAKHFGYCKMPHYIWRRLVERSKCSRYFDVGLGKQRKSFVRMRVQDKKTWNCSFPGITIQTFPEISNLVEWWHHSLYTMNLFLWTLNHINLGS